MSVLRSMFGARVSRHDDSVLAARARRKGSFSAAPLVTIISAVTVFASFGAIVVRAGEDSGVREFIRQSGAPSLPALFRSAERPRYIAYAPHVVYQDSRLPYFPSANLNARRLRAVLSPPRPHTQVARTHKNVRVSGAGIVQKTAYCVRLCDGYEFPLGPAADRASQEEACQQACPASPSALFVAPAGSDGVAGGRDRSGTLYTALPNAFAYRTSVSPTCGCSNISGQGMARPAVQHDITLKSGDIVMTERGLSVFSWTASRARRFTSIHQAASLSESDRRKLKALEAGTIARAPTTSRQAQADLPALEFQAQSDLSTGDKAVPEAGQPAGFVRIIPRTPPLLR